MESIKELIPEEFNRKYERSLNRFRYEVKKGIGEKIKVRKPLKSWHKTEYLCGKCGTNICEAVYEYCPKCGTAIKR